LHLIVFMFLCEHLWDLPSTVFMFLCEHLWDLPSTNFAVFQHYQHHFQNVACFSHHRRHCWNTPPTVSLCPHPLFGLCKCSASIDDCQWVQFFHMEEFSDISVLYTLPCQMQICQTAPLLLSVSRQQTLQTIGGKFQPVLPYHQHPPLTSWANSIK
jgi:hypothetical protein